MLTPKGYFVSVLVSWMAFRSASGEGCVSAVMRPVAREGRRDQHNSQVGRRIVVRVLVKLETGRQCERRFQPHTTPFMKWFHGQY